MKTIVEFGIRGDRHISQTFSSIKAGLAFYVKISWLFGHEVNKTHLEYRKFGKDCPSMSWSSSTHFVAISVLDDVPRGSPVSKLWKKEEK